MTLRNRIAAFVRRWVAPTPSEAAAVLSKHARSNPTLKHRYDEMHARLRAARDAGYVRGVKVR